MTVTWNGADGERRSCWRSEAGAPPPTELREIDDRARADVVVRRLRAGEWLAHRGDFRNARELLSAVQRRWRRRKKPEPDKSLLERFHAKRLASLQEAEGLSRLLVALDGEYRLELAHAPDVRLACEEAWGPPPGEPTLVALRELLGVVGAHEWRRKGVRVAGLGAVHPHYGVFAPIRSEYLDLVTEALVPHPVAGKRIFDLGTGTGVLGLLLAKHGAREVLATDVDGRAVACAVDNARGLGLADRFRAEERDLFPGGRADIVVINPPWLPAKPRTRLDRAVYDEGGRVLARFLADLRDHLEPSGEGWLILSDLAERIGLRRPGELERAIADAGLAVRWKRSVAAKHPRSRDEEDPLFEARSTETTTLWALGARA